MNKLFGFVLVLAIGLGAGVFVGVMIQTLQTPETPQTGIQGRVTIEGISCTFSDNDAELEILLKDHFPQTDLEGNVTIYQDGPQWTGEVDWHLNGYGYAEIRCDTINGNGSFRMKYRDNYTSVMYIDRTIDWDEIDITWTFMATEQLEIQGAEFIAGNNVNVTAQNTGTSDLTVSKYKIGVSGNPTALSASVDIAQGASAEVTVPLTWVSGTTYDIYLITSTGKQFPYRATAP